MTPDEKEKMYAKEMARRRMAKDMEVQLRHMRYVEEVRRLEQHEEIKMDVKLTGLAMAFLEKED
jgi:hypothetical protein